MKTGFFISVQDAQRSLNAYPLTPGSVRVPLQESAGRVLAEDVRADRDYPPYDRVMMDGIALSGRQLKGARTFQVVGIQRAGEAVKGLVTKNGCFEVTTGAVLPKGCDQVVPVEDLIRKGDLVEVHRSVRPQKGANIHARGSDARKGDILLKKGGLVSAQQTALLASCGKARVRVIRDLRVQVLSTGNEVKPVGSRLRPYQIRASNREAVSAILKENGITRLKSRICSDQKAALRSAVKKALLENDVILINGGISKGRFDLVPEILSELKVPIVFRFVRQRPGKPFLFAFSGQGKAVFGLPGNPASTFVTLVRYVLPYLRKCQGLPEQPVLMMTLSKTEVSDGAFTYFRPVRLKRSRSGVLQGTTIPFSCSGDLIAWTKADGFIELSRGRTRFVKDESVRVHVF